MENLSINDIKSGLIIVGIPSGSFLSITTCDVYLTDINGIITGSNLYTSNNISIINEGNTIVWQFIPNQISGVAVGNYYSIQFYISFTDPITYPQITSYYGLFNIVL